MTFKCEHGADGWRGWDDQFPDCEASGVRLMAVRREVETLVRERQERPVIVAGDVIRSLRRSCARMERTIAHAGAACEDVNLKEYLAIRASRRRKFSRILKTQRLADALTYYESEEAARRQLFKIIRILLNAPEDPKQYFQDAAKETELYRKALAGIEGAIVASGALTIVAGPLLTGESDESAYTHLIAARDALRRDLQTLMRVMRSDVIQGYHLGKRGNAASATGARRGLVARSLDETIPESFPEHYALIAGLMRAAGFSITATQVRNIVR